MLRKVMRSLPLFSGEEFVERGRHHPRRPRSTFLDPGLVPTFIK
jgi:hypothetical protein